MLYWNETAWPIIYSEDCIILALLLFFCYQNGQHNQHATIKGINSLADWTLIPMATFGLISCYTEMKQFGQWYTLSIASYWLSCYSFAISMANTTNMQALMISAVWLIKNCFWWQHLGWHHTILKFNSLANNIYWILHHLGSVSISLQSARPIQPICNH